MFWASTCACMNEPSQTEYRSSIHSTIHTRTRTHGPHSPCAADALYLSHLTGKFLCESHSMHANTRIRIHCIRHFCRLSLCANHISSHFLNASRSFFYPQSSHMISHSPYIASLNCLFADYMRHGMAWHCIHTIQACSSSIALSRSRSMFLLGIMSVCVCAAAASVAAGGALSFTEYIQTGSLTEAVW